MNDLQMIFVGAEYAEPKRILEGLSFGEAGKQISIGVHTPYEELFHLVYWQEIMLERIRSKERITGSEEEHFPETAAPPDEASWEALKAACFAGLEQALELAAQSADWNDTLASGSTVRAQLEKLAVHNAYHFGKIVLLRQLMKLWSSS